MASILGGVGSVLGGITGGKGASKAAKAQAQAQQAAIAEQQRQFDTTQANFEPFRQAGLSGLSGEMGLLGLNGGDAQQQAIDALKASPGFTSLYNVGQDTVLQNAAATGGLRGGNTNNSLAQFGSGLLSQLIQQQLGAYGGLANLGAGATNSVAGFGANAAGNIGNNLVQQGNANATAAAAPYAALQGVISQLTGAGGGLSGLLSSSKTPGIVNPSVNLSDIQMPALSF
jgi:hypothetical protein